MKKELELIFYAIAAIFVFIPWLLPCVYRIFVSASDRSVDSRTGVPARHRSRKYQESISVYLREHFPDDDDYSDQAVPMDPGEVKLPEKLCALREVDKSQLYTDLHDFTAGSTDMPVPVRGAGEEAGYTIPTGPEPAPSLRQLPSAIPFDLSRLKQARRDARQVSQILSESRANAEEFQQIGRPIPTSPEPTPGQDGTLDVSLLEQARRDTHQVSQILSESRAGAEEAQQIGSPILASPESAPTPDRAIALDMSRLEQVRRDTHQVSQILSEVFTDVEVEDVPGAEISVPEDEEGPLVGLDADHRLLLGALLTREHWPRGDYARLCSESGLMAEGALATINDWAFDTYDDAIIEDGETLVIHKGLLQGVSA